MAASYSAVIHQDGEWWIGWVEEIPGVNFRVERERNFWTIYVMPSRKHSR